DAAVGLQRDSDRPIHGRDRRADGRRDDAARAERSVERAVAVIADERDVGAAGGRGAEAGDDDATIGLDREGLARLEGNAGWQQARRKAAYSGADVGRHDAVAAEARVERAVGIEARDENRMLRPDGTVARDDDLAVGLRFHAVPFVGVQADVGDYDA